MKYKIGDEFTFVSKSGKSHKVEITDILFKFDYKINNKLALSEIEIDELIADDVLTRGTDDYINSRIKQLEDELGIKLERTSQSYQSSNS